MMVSRILWSFSVALLICCTYLEDSFAEELANGGSFSGLIEQNNQVISHTFFASEDSIIDITMVDMAGDRCGINPFIAIVDPLGASLGSDSDLVVSRITGVASASGTYTVTARHDIYNGSCGRPTGPYDIHLVVAPGANEEGQLANGDLSIGDLSRGDLDTFTFDAAQGNTIDITMVDTEQCGINPTLRVVAPDKSTWGTVSDLTVARLTGRATVSGTYTVIASHLTFNGSCGSLAGPYEVHLVVAPGASEEGQLASGSKISNNLTRGDLDTFTFQAAQGSTVDITMVDTEECGINPTINVITPNGESWNSDSDLSVARVTGTTPVTGTYTIIASHLNFNGSCGRLEGDYDVHLVVAPGANEEGLLTNGQRTARYITRGDLDTFTFLASQGDSVRVSMSELGGQCGINPTFSIVNPDGSLWESSSGLASATVSGIVSTTGPYTIIASHVDFSGSCGTDTGWYSISLQVQQKSISYAALGDSYSSGEGVPPYLDSSDTLWSGCHRSTFAYPRLLKLPGMLDPIALRTTTDFTFLACSGATTDNVTASGTGQYDSPPQLASSTFRGAERDLVAISIGGNDARFADILKFCFAHNNCNSLRPFDPYSNLELGEFFNLLVGPYVRIQLQDLYKEIVSTSPNASVVVLGYPLLVGGNECQSAAIPLLEDSKLSTEEQQWIRDANTKLNDIIEDSTAAIGLHFVAVAELFDGHEVCGRKDPWISGFTFPDYKTSFHPTAQGQRMLAKAASDYLDSISSNWPYGYNDAGLPMNPPSRTSSRNLTLVENDKLPLVGQLSVSLNTGLAQCDSLRSVVVRDELVVIQGQGFKSGETVDITFTVDNTAIALGTTVADASGSINAQLTIPDTTKFGEIGVIQALGAGVSGSGLLLIELVRVEASTTLDSDGDGIFDGCDNCSTKANPVQEDTNFDGIGDACRGCSDYFPGLSGCEYGEQEDLELKNNTWTLVGLPARPPRTNNTVLDVFGDDISGVYGETWVAYIYDPSESRYIDLGPLGQLEPGDAFWVFQMSGEDVLIDMPEGSLPTELGASKACETDSGCFSLVLESGDQDYWNMVGNPFYTDISVDALRVTTVNGRCADSDGCTLLEASDEPMVLSDNLWYYDGSEYQFLSASDYLKPWTGYWSFVYGIGGDASPVLRMSRP